MKLLAAEQAERIGWSVEGWRKMVFVTATLPAETPNPRVISECWTNFVRRLRMAYPALRVVRVLQKHPGGHGWHVHALFDRCIPADDLLHFGKLAGLGRMDFQLVDQHRRQNVIGYVSRYVTRDMRCRNDIPKRTRLIDTAGARKCVVRWWKRVCDLTVESNAGKLRQSMLSILRLRHGINLSDHAPSIMIFGYAPPDAIAEWWEANGLAAAN